MLCYVERNIHIFTATILIIKFIIVAVSVCILHLTYDNPLSNWKTNNTFRKFMTFSFKELENQCAVVFFWVTFKLSLWATVIIFLINKLIAKHYLKVFKYMLGERHKTCFLFLKHVKVEFKLENSRGRKIEDKEKD